ncbi:hypothetical protein GCM10023185_02500 [Hymenobacter saemangeumensis]|uniref:DUF2004 domain-containing protein n=1 Tax=Hymenobacter saemangeumensis TaxID=1084522 RepID=A0ABP8HYA1_9BACT
MGFFSFLFDKPITIEDKVFGTLRQKTYGKNRQTSWRTESLCFEPTSRNVSCAIDAGPDGPTEKQQAFFQKIEQDYLTLRSALIPVLEDEFQNWKPDFKIQDFATEFWLVGLSIPELGASPVEWEWSFETVHDENHMLTISMIDSTPQAGVCFDG